LLEFEQNWRQRQQRGIQLECLFPLCQNPQLEVEDSDIRERDRQELIERDENIRAQLGDITNLVQDLRDMYEERRH
jgi:hypothetical protein